MNTDPPSQDCGHRYCRVLSRAVARGRPPRGRCRKRCPAAAGFVPLHRLGRGQAGRIVHVGGGREARRRLLELGLLRGETITLQRVAPLGDPLEFVVKGYHVSLRERDAAEVTVEVSQPRTAPA